MLRWARERAGYSIETLTGRFPKLEAWERGEVLPTLRQLETFAVATHTPFGFLFLTQPPDEKTPIPDFRTVANARVSRPSPDLLDTVYLCQQRRDWYRDFARSMRELPVGFVGSARIRSGVVETAARMRQALGVELEERGRHGSWTEALRRFIGLADTVGILVMVSGVVGSNNRRRLDPQEFRGFALADSLAPLVFVNGADTKAAQMFTLAHELAHIWLGESGVSDADARAIPEQRTERWCNRVAAEFLVPLQVLRGEVDPSAVPQPEVRRLARRFKVSTLVVLRRFHDAGLLSRNDMWAAYDAELDRLRAVSTSGGGNFYLTLGARVSRRFARALVVSTLEGRTPFTDTFRLLGLKKMATFNELGRSLGVGY